MRIGVVHPASRRVWWRASVLAGTLLSAACTSAPFTTASPAPTDRAAIIHLLHRATYGPRPEDVEEVLRVGAHAWLERQLQPAPALVAQATSQAAAQPRIRAELPPVDMMQAAREQLVRLRTTQAIGTLVQTKLERAVHAERQLEEIMTDFWFNHFNVFYNKAQVRTALPDYEQNAIGRHVFGRFEDMLLATAQHPAMLVYLDNFTSTAPVASQPAGPRRPQRGGLNENYARELLELHTLGVDGGYTQQDVIEVARAFTGWGILTRATTRVQPAGNGAAATAATVPGVVFQFNAQRHDSGEKQVLGQVLPAGRGLEDGLDVIRLLAQHPATAEHIATKLVRHFVADDPPRQLVADLAAVFRETRGDLRAVTRALFTAKAFYDPAHYRAKTRRPFEFVAAALRLTGARVEQNQVLVQQLRAFGHLPYSEAAPTGYPTVAEEWLSAGALMSRMRFAVDLAAGRVAGVQFPPEAMLGAPPQAPRRPRADNGASPMDAEAVRSLTAALLHRLLPGVPSDRLEAVIADDLAAQQTSDPRTLNTRVAGLVLGSPEFQRY
jgi:uncharacterized protein (DUF1800 family)